MSQFQNCGLILRRENLNVTPMQNETFIAQNVNYTLELDGEFIVVENVPARVCVQTGEKLFSPETVERLQKIVLEKKKPSRLIQTPVFQFAA